jgi:dihydrofolate reductase
MWVTVERPDRKAGMSTRKLISFVGTSLDGYHEDLDHGIGWMNLSDDFGAYSVSQLDELGGLVFGRRTYDGMVAYWTGAEAQATSPEVAARMHALPKTVVSRSPGVVEWTNTTTVTGDVAEAIAGLKRQPGNPLALFGSSTLTTHLLEAGLIDELRIMLSPVLLGAGRSLFAGLAPGVPFDLLRVTTFRSGNVLLCYRPRPDGA